MSQLANMSPDKSRTRLRKKRSSTPYRGQLRLKMNSIALRIAKDIIRKRCHVGGDMDDSRSMEAWVESLADDFGKEVCVAGQHDGLEGSLSMEDVRMDRSEVRQRMYGLMKPVYDDFSFERLKTKIDSKVVMKENVVIGFQMVKIRKLDNHVSSDIHYIQKAFCHEVGLSMFEALNQNVVYVVLLDEESLNISMDAIEYWFQLLARYPDSLFLTIILTFKMQTIEHTFKISQLGLYWIPRIYENFMNEKELSLEIFRNLFMEFNVDVTLLPGWSEQLTMLEMIWIKGSSPSFLLRMYEHVLDDHFSNNPKAYLAFFSGLKFNYDHSMLDNYRYNEIYHRSIIEAGKERGTMPLMVAHELRSHLHYRWRYFTLLDVFFDIFLIVVFHFTMQTEIPEYIKILKIKMHAEIIRHKMIFTESLMVQRMMNQIQHFGLTQEQQKSVIKVWKDRLSENSSSEEIAKIELELQSSTRILQHCLGCNHILETHMIQCKQCKTWYHADCEGHHIAFPCLISDYFCSKLCHFTNPVAEYYDEGFLVSSKAPVQEVEITGMFYSSRPILKYLQKIAMLNEPFDRSYKDLFTMEVSGNKDLFWRKIIPTQTLSTITDIISNPTVQDNLVLKFRDIVMNFHGKRNLDKYRYALMLEEFGMEDSEESQKLFYNLLDNLIWMGLI